MIAVPEADASGGAVALPPEGRKRYGTLGWDILFIGDLAIFGLLFLFTAVLGIQQLISGDTPNVGETTRGTLWVSVLISFVAFGAIPFLWVVGTRNEPWRGAMRYLQLDKPWPAAAEGILWFIGLLILVLSAVGLQWLITGEIPENPAVEDIQRVMTWPLAFAFAFSAAFGEEILFRGILQKYVGLWGQAFLFGLAHAGYATVLQLVLPFIIGLAYGYIIKRGRSLWVAIVSHFLYDFFVASSALWGG